jgi:hypothetical protein
LNTDDLENFEAERELHLAQEYQDVVGMFRYAVETDRRFYLANNVDVKVLSEGPRPIVEVVLIDAWVWDMYRKSRFVPRVRVLSFKDLNIEELPRVDL